MGARGFRHGLAEEARSEAASDGGGVELSHERKETGSRLLPSVSNRPRRCMPGLSRQRELVDLDAPSFSSL
jgi:hypothetical protein